MWRIHVHVSSWRTVSASYANSETRQVAYSWLILYIVSTDGYPYFDWDPPLRSLRAGPTSVVPLFSIKSRYPSHIKQHAYKYLPLDSRKAVTVVRTLCTQFFM